MSNSRYPEPTSVAPAFPQRRAFVLRFSADAGPQTGLFCGRIEHVTTGDTAEFRSTDELWAFVRDVLTSPSHAASVPALPRSRASG